MIVNLIIMHAFDIFELKVVIALSVLLFSKVKEKRKMLFTMIISVQQPPSNQTNSTKLLQNTLASAKTIRT